MLELFASTAEEMQQELRQALSLAFPAFDDDRSAFPVADKVAPPRLLALNIEAKTNA